MSENPTLPPDEAPGNRLRRLMSEDGDAGMEALDESRLEGMPAEGPDITGDSSSEKDVEPQDQDGKQGDETPESSTVEFVSLASVLKDPESGKSPPAEKQAGEGDRPEPTPGSTPPSKRRTMPPPPPALGDTPHKSPPALGTQGMPLPRRVDEIDMDATRVTPSAYTHPPRAHRPGTTLPGRPALTRPAPSRAALDRAPQPAGATRQGPPAASQTYTAWPVERPRPSVNWRQGLGCLIRMFVLGLVALILLMVAVGSFMLYEYYQISAKLPSVDDLQQRASQFETTRILDRNGNVLYEILDPSAGRRTYVKMDKISPYLVAAIIATEDKEFYSNPGVDLVAIARAFWYNFQGGETISGASTITQQLTRTLLFIPEERTERSYVRKVREALLAAEITRRYTKDQILELYLNEIYFGNLAYGIEAASETYFGVSAEKLTLGQAAFLAGLPQAPSVYDVYTNREVTLKRFESVLRLMMDASKEDNCIFVSNNPQRICVETDTALAAYNEIYAYQFHSPEVQMRYPHWVNYVRSLLEAQYDSQTIYRAGFTVYTTIDPALQEAAEQLVRQQIETLVDKNAHNGALVAIRPRTGEILAMVGSADFYNEDIDGQVNMATSPRQPGSAMKPLTYLAAFEKGWTVSTLIWDVPSEFPPSGNPNYTMPPYIPVNYDGRFHGPVTVRSALANSYNIPAVKALQYVGIYNDPNAPGEDGLLALARRVGLTTLTSDQYGLALTLGGGEVSLLEFTGVYATFANLGSRVPPYAISRILDSRGNVVYDFQPGPGEQVIRPEHAFLINSILSDNDARTPMFGANSVLNLPFPAAAKTGTTNDFRDNWTVGYTTDLAVGVWVGNADYTPMQNTSGLTGAAPIWSEFMKTAVPYVTGNNPTPFFRPAGIVDRVICAVSGTEPSQWCPTQRSEFYGSGQPPLPREQDLWSRVNLDTWTNLIASPACGNFTSEEMVLNVTDPWAIKWIQDTQEGRDWADELGFSNPILFVPQRECRSDDPRPLLEMISPVEGQTITSAPLDIFGKADAPSNFRSFRISYGLGNDPVQWINLVDSAQPVSQPDRLYTWDLGDVPAGVVTIHLIMYSNQNNYAEIFRRVNVQVPTPTPTPTETPTPLPTDTPVPPTETSTPTLPPPSETPSPTP
ncbi:MAG: hypothetical protein EHM70_08400 [Chloroflexota bacterium]|nr:MAG: hypothetical protein EHM70_08400 [Chloroflexota bacterium]